MSELFDATVVVFNKTCLFPISVNSRHNPSEQGFRLGTKMGLDQAILGGRDLEETVEELTDLHKNWVLGVEEEESWGRGIEAGVANLWGVHSVREDGGSVVYRLVPAFDLLSK